MKLTELNPRWQGSGGEGITFQGVPVPRREGVGITFDCPCGKCERPLTILFKNPLDGGQEVTSHSWNREGLTFETLSLTPSIRRLDNCGWHGYVTEGKIVTLPN